MLLNQLVLGRDDDMNDAHQEMMMGIGLSSFYF